MKRYKITQPGFEGYTGYLGSVFFENAISTESVSQGQVFQLAAMFSVVEVGDDGEEVGFGIQHNMINGVTIAAPILETHEEQEAVAPSGPVSQHDIAAATPHTKEDLEKIADESGIKGLRAVADKIGARARSIPDMIVAILKREAELGVTTERVFGERESDIVVEGGETTAISEETSTAEPQTAEVVESV